MTNAGIPSDRFATERVLVAGWLPQNERSAQRATRLFGFALDKWNDFFDAPPISVPTPPVPTLLPRFVWQTTDGTSQFDVGDVRVNLTWGDSAHPVSDPAPTVASLASKLTILGEGMGLSFTRLALVLNRRADYDQPGQMLVTRFIQPDWAGGLFADTVGFEIHSHVRRAVSAAPECNVWLRIKTGPENGPTYDHLIVVQDINTVPSEALHPPNEIDVFSSAALHECDILLKQAMEGVIFKP